MGNKKVKYAIYTLVGIVMIIISISGYKVVSEHQKKEYLVVQLKIKEAANKCYVEKICTEKITLQKLYDLKYVEKLYDPITKEEMNPEMCIEFVDHLVNFCD